MAFLGQVGVKLRPVGSVGVLTPIAAIKHTQEQVEQAQQLQKERAKARVGVRPELEKSLRPEYVVQREIARAAGPITSPAQAQQALGRAQTIYEKHLKEYESLMKRYEVLTSQIPLLEAKVQRLYGV